MPNRQRFAMTSAQQDISRASSNQRTPYPMYDKCPTNNNMNIESKSNDATTLPHQSTHSQQRKSKFQWIATFSIKSLNVFGPSSPRRSTRLGSDRWVSLCLLCLQVLGLGNIIDTLEVLNSLSRINVVACMRHAPHGHRPRCWIVIVQSLGF